MSLFFCYGLGISEIFYCSRVRSLLPFRRCRQVRRPPFLRAICSSSFRIIVRPGNSQPDSGMPCADCIKPSNLGRSPRHIFNKTVVKLWPYLGDTKTRFCKVFENQQFTKSCCASDGTRTRTAFQAKGF